MHMEKAPITWVLVADARTAQIYLPKFTERYIPLADNGNRHPSSEQHIREFKPILVKPFTAESLKIYETGRNKTGIVFESFSPSRHSAVRHMAEPHVDVRKEIKQHFARRIADFINQAKDGKAFDRLILIAPPEMLGEIDAKLSRNIRRKVILRLAKELTHKSTEDLACYLKNYF